MEALAVILVLLFVATWFVSRVNARHEARAGAAAPPADERVEEAWDEFGADDPAEVAHARLDRLADDVRVDAIARTATLVRYAVMASRAGRHALLPALAARAEALNGACGETRSLRALADALAGDDAERAKASLLAAQSAVAGCSKCSATLESKLLAEELVIAAQSLEDREAEAAETAPGEGDLDDESPAQAPGALHVRIVRTG